jgi:hypothetical protein
MTEPPLTILINTQIIIEAISDVDLVRSEISDKFSQMPCHTQSVESV